MEEQPPLQRLEEVGQFCTAKDFGFGPACPSSLHSLALTWASRGWVVPIVEMRSPFVFRAMVHISFRYSPRCVTFPLLPPIRAPLSRSRSARPPTPDGCRTAKMWVEEGFPKGARRLLRQTDAELGERQNADIPLPRPAEIYVIIVSATKLQLGPRSLPSIHPFTPPLPVLEEVERCVQRDIAEGEGVEVLPARGAPCPSVEKRERGGEGSSLLHCRQCRHLSSQQCSHAARASFGFSLPRMDKLWWRNPADPPTKAFPSRIHPDHNFSLHYYLNKIPLQKFPRPQVSLKAIAPPLGSAGSWVKYFGSIAGCCPALEPALSNGVGVVIR